VRFCDTAPDLARLQLLNSILRSQQTGGPQRLLVGSRRADRSECWWAAATTTATAK
jgi:hypothetical protein